MKKILLSITLLLLLCLLLSPVCSAAEAEEGVTLSPANTVMGEWDSYILGDADMDGKITNADALAIFRYIYDPEQYPLPILCNHTFGEWTVVEEQDCLRDGLQKRTCSKCNGVEEQLIKAPGKHDEVIDPAVPATCTETGLTAGKHCTACGEVLVAQQTQAALGHSYVATFIPPTTTIDGYTQYNCSACGDSYQADNVTPTDLVIDNNNVTWVGYTGAENEELVIPAVFEHAGTWYRVTGIGEMAFYYCTRLASITIPDSVTSIDHMAFYNLSKLTSITIGSGVTHIGDSAFKGCTSLTSITIPDSVTSIGEWAFSGCTGLRSVTIGKHVTEICQSAFYGCTGLTSVTIPDNVSSIGKRAFSGCSNLKSVTIGSGVTSIDEVHFSNVRV